MRKVHNTKFADKYLMSCDYKVRRKSDMGR